MLRLSFRGQKPSLAGKLDMRQNKNNIGIPACCIAIYWLDVYLYIAKENREYIRTSVHIGIFFCILLRSLACDFIEDPFLCYSPSLFLPNLPNSPEITKASGERKPLFYYCTRTYPLVHIVVCLSSASLPCLPLATLKKPQMQTLPTQVTPPHPPPSLFPFFTLFSPSPQSPFSVKVGE